jgi:type II restriction enzyme
MIQLTASDVVKAINRLSKNQEYNYIKDTTTTKLIIEDVTLPEGPIRIRRYDPNKGERRIDAKSASISRNLIWRVANSVISGIPLNLDRVLAGTGNIRSALETLMAHTPQFYFCYPGRIQITTSSKKIEKGQKHILWQPDNPHKQGMVSEAKLGSEMAISELPVNQIVYESLVLPDKSYEIGISVEELRRHAQIQVSLVEIGNQLGFRTWVAQNDKGLIYNGKKIGELDYVVGSLQTEKMISPHDNAVNAALYIDCIWFRNSRFMPAVIEVEHTTGVTSGLSRMKTLQDLLPPGQTRYVIAAPDEARDKVMIECNKQQFKSLNAYFFPYSAVEELCSLTQRRKIRGVNDEFLECFMEQSLIALNE